MAARFAAQAARAALIRTAAQLSPAQHSPVRVRRPAAPRPPSDPPHPGARPREHDRNPPLPRRFGWLIRLVPAAACSRSQLIHLLSDPEIASLLSAAPQMGQVLRRLCRMLGIRPPDPIASLLRNLSRSSSREQTPGSQSWGSNTARSAGPPLLCHSRESGNLVPPHDTPPQTPPPPEPPPA